MEHLQQLNPFFKEHDLRGLNPLNGVIDALAVTQAAPVVKARRSGEIMDIKKILIYARSCEWLPSWLTSKPTLRADWVVDRFTDLDVLLDSVPRNHGSWVIAYDNGAYTLHVGPYRINIDVAKTEEFQEVLSHRWEPVLNTTFGPLPKNMMTAGYLRPTWVDFLNHFNISEFRERVDHDRGALFSQKQCRALYLEREVPFHIQVAACARTRLWQEIGVGPQAHQYGSVEAVWLHFVAAVGEVVSSYAAADLQSISKIVTDIASGAETENTWRYKHGENDAVSKLFREYKNGALQSFVSQVFRMKGWVHSDHFVRALTSSTPHGVQRICHTIPGTDRGYYDTRRRAERCPGLLDEVTVVIYQCVQALAKYKKSDASGWTDNTHAITDVHRHHFLDSLRRSGVLSIEMSKKAANGILDQTQSGWRLTSAIANFGNRNATDDVDRVAASFSIFCALRKVHCGPSMVSELVYSEENVDVACLRASQCAGITAIECKKIGFKKIGERRSDQHVEPEGFDLLSKVVTGDSLELSICEQVWISGLTLRNCTLTTKKSLFGDKGNITKWFSTKNETGEVLGFRIKGNEVAQLRLRLDDGSFVSVIPQAQGASDPQRFREWHSNLPAAQEDDFGWL